MKQQFQITESYIRARIIGIMLIIIGILYRGTQHFKQQFSMTESYIRARIIGIMLIIIGFIFLVNPTSINIKIGFILILMGVFMIFIITDKSIPKKISDAQVKGNMNTIKKLIKELDLNGNAVFLPKSDILSEERIFIPPNKSGIIKIPTIDDDNDNVIITGADGKNLGISIPPSGLKLLKEIEKDRAFKNIRLENIEEKLQLLVGINLLKSVSFKKQQYGWNLEIERHVSNNNNQNLHNQYPCPTCSAVITMITRALNKKIRIYDITYNGDKITFRLNFVKRRVKTGE